MVKIETLASLAELLGVSLATLLGIEIEYISSAVTYFERLRQLEEAATGSSSLPDRFRSSSARRTSAASCRICSRKAWKAKTAAGTLLQDVARILEILDERRKNYERRGLRSSNLMAALDVERLLRSGFVGRPLMAVEEVRVRQHRARAEIEHFAHFMEAEPMGIQIGLVTGTLPHTGFQIFRSGDRKTLSISPFRLGEQPNIRLGVAMITENHEAVSLHEAVVDEMWRTALKGREAAAYLRNMIASIYG